MKYRMGANFRGHLSSTKIENGIHENFTSQPDFAAASPVWNICWFMALLKDLRPMNDLNEIITLDKPQKFKPLPLYGSCYILLD